MLIVNKLVHALEYTGITVKDEGDKFKAFCDKLILSKHKSETRNKELEVYVRSLKTMTDNALAQNSQLERVLQEGGGIGGNAARGPRSVEEGGGGG